MYPTESPNAPPSRNALSRAYQAPEATPSLSYDASAEVISSAISALQPVKSAGALVEVERSGPFVGGGYTWSIAFKLERSVDGDEFAALASPFPTIGVQQANVTGTGVRVTIERQKAHEAGAVEHLVSLAAPLPAETAEEQVFECYVNGMTPSEAALAGVSFSLAFRGETTEVSSLLTDGGCLFQHAFRDKLDDRCSTTVK